MFVAIPLDRSSCSNTSTYRIVGNSLVELNWTAVPEDTCATGYNISLPGTSATTSNNILSVTVPGGTNTIPVSVATLDVFGEKAGGICYVNITGKYLHMIRL